MSIYPQQAVAPSSSPKLVPYPVDWFVLRREDSEVHPDDVLDNRASAGLPGLV